VLLRIEVNGKFTDSWAGPFTIHKKLSQLSYDLFDSTSNSIFNASVGRIKLAATPLLPPPNATHLLSTDPSTVDPSAQHPVVPDSSVPIVESVPVTFDPVTTDPVPEIVVDPDLEVPDVPLPTESAFKRNRQRIVLAAQRAKRKANAAHKNTKSDTNQSVNTSNTKTTFKSKKKQSTSNDNFPTVEQNTNRTLQMEDSDTERTPEQWNDPTVAIPYSSNSSEIQNNRPRRTPQIPDRTVYSTSQRVTPNFRRIKIPENAVPKRIIDRRLAPRPGITGHKTEWLVEFTDANITPIYIPEEQFKEFHGIKKDQMIRAYEKTLLK